MADNRKAPGLLLPLEDYQITDRQVGALFNNTDSVLLKRIQTKAFLESFEW